ncbi:MAG: acetyl-CoA carboxylase biotin carboxylase subunit [Candidatus Kryptoniota bacterium]
MKNIQKVLVANRGEIALRILRTIREMGLLSVAVYSDIDVTMPFVRYADEAYNLEGKEAKDTYLNIEKLISIAKISGADAVHPGYGFLSENAEFANAVIKAGLIFIGPSPNAISSMGDKTAARRLAKDFGVPVVPGMENPILDIEEAVSAAEKVGYPVLIKAAAGGGGKGMRVVQSRAELEGNIRAAKSEALSAFGDDRVYIEKFISNPRHVEFQILADEYGNIVHLFERECSIQRRHQKVIEETPSPALTEEVRHEMGEAAIRAAKACQYTNAGTVEFVIDDKGHYYFLEMNTRLQVEHPITELTTGIDIVKEQVKIAQGEKLSFSQEDVMKQGHAIECRIYAEDVHNSFLPDTGVVKFLREPSGNGVRVDSGVESGNEISVYYDPMIAKLSVWARTREDAIRKMKRALDEYVVLGVKTTIPFCSFVMESAPFKSGRYSTNFVSEFWNTQPDSNDIPRDAFIVASVVLKSSKAIEDGKEEVKMKSKWLDRRFEE